MNSTIASYFLTQTLGQSAVKSKGFPLLQSTTSRTFLPRIISVLIADFTRVFGVARDQHSTLLLSTLFARLFVILWGDMFGHGLTSKSGRICKNSMWTVLVENMPALLEQSNWNLMNDRCPLRFRRSLCNWPFRGCSYCCARMQRNMHTMARWNVSSTIGFGGGVDFRQTCCESLLLTPQFLPRDNVQPHHFIIGQSTMKKYPP